MKKNWLITAVVVLTLVLGGLVVKSKFFSKPKTGALQISTTPKAVVYINGEQRGTTPFLDDKLEVGEYTIKLVPESTTDSLVSWEGKINLVPGIITVINRTLSKTDSESSGEILALEKISSRDRSALAVVSIPDQALVKINGEPKGFAPILEEDLAPGDYRVVVSSAGYEEKTITAQTVAGYKLTVNVQLAQKIEGIAEATPSAETEEEEEEEEEEEVEEEEEASPTPTPEASPRTDITPPDKPYVEIKDTPTNWLNVRSEPSADKGDETILTKVDPGEMFPYLGEEESGWYKIEYEEGEEGWVSGVYSDLVE